MGQNRKPTIHAPLSLPAGGRQPPARSRVASTRKNIIKTLFAIANAVNTTLNLSWAAINGSSAPITVPDVKIIDKKVDGA